MGIFSVGEEQAESPMRKEIQVAMIFAGRVFILRIILGQSISSGRGEWLKEWATPALAGGARKKTSHHRDHGVHRDF